MTVPFPPPSYRRIRLVRTFDELVSTPLENDVNALCWPRELTGDFDEVVERLNVGEGITTLDPTRLLDLELSDAGKIARDILIQDQELISSADLVPNLDCIRDARRDLSGAPVCTDVFSWHADSATALADTWLCSYNTAATEGLRNDEAIRRVDVPETRAELLARFGGKDDETFLNYLTEYFYDLHYVPLPHARPFSFGFGNLWRIATAYPGSPVPPCIHRAPTTQPGQVPRLLLMC